MYTILDQLRIPGVFRIDFPIAFDVASAAVHKRLLYASHGNDVPYIQSPGLMQFRARLPADITLLITVEKYREDKTALEAAMDVPDGYQSSDLDRIAFILFQQCLHAVLMKVREEIPNYGECYQEGVTPEPPIIRSSSDWPRLFLWQEVHAIKEKDYKLALLVGHKEQTLRNARSAYKKMLTGTPTRGKQKLLPDIGE